jgi:hypothetical protein
MRTACFLALVAGIGGCGARTGFDEGPPRPGSQDASGPGASCLSGGATHAPCASWKAAGPYRILAPGGQLGSVIPVGCDVLIGWVAGSPSGMNNIQLDWYTLLATFDGAAAGPTRRHPSLSDVTAASATFELAAGAGGAAAMAVDQNGCRFLPLDETGADRGPPVTLGEFDCVSLAGTAASFSLLYTRDANTPTTLLTVDGSGAILSSRTLADAPMRVLWSRLVRSDGSFLLNTFAEDSTTAVYTDWLQGFDSQGNALASSFTSAADIAPVLLAETQRGALAAWSFGYVAFEPVDGTGAPLGPPQSTPLSQSIYGEALASMANGDVLATVLVLDSPSNAWTILVQERGPDGTERGGFSAFSGPPDGFQPDTVQVLAAPDGGHALLVYTDEANPGIHTLPIACAD